jgi:GNAT superfamily N-acetyltransferase
VFTLMVVSQRFVGGMLRHFPNYAFVLLVAQTPGEPLAGFGSIRMVARGSSAPWAKFGFMVAGDRQGRGIGTRIARAMYEAAVELGVRTGGGTMLVDNGPSRALAERFGFRLSVSRELDPVVPDRQVLHSRSDLGEVLARGPAPGGELRTPELGGAASDAASAGAPSRPGEPDTQ